MTIAISTAALAISLTAFLYGRWRDKRDLMLRIHDYLVSVEQQRGRRALYVMKDTQQQVSDLSADDYALINNSLAALNVLGLYYLRRYIRRKDALELWAVPVLRTLLAAEVFLAHRDVESGMPIWPQLREFGQHARVYADRHRLTVQISAPAPPAQPPAGQAQVPSNGDRPGHLDGI